MNFPIYLFEQGEPFAGSRVSVGEFTLMISDMQRMMTLGKLMTTSGRASRAELILLNCALDHEHRFGDNITVAQTAKDLGVPMPSVSRLLRSLTEKGFIERYNDPADRRNVHIKVTESGINELKSVLGNIFSIIDKAMLDFSDEEISLMIDLRHRFTDSVFKALNEGRTTDNAGN